MDGFLDLLLLCHFVQKLTTQGCCELIRFFVIELSEVDTLPGLDRRGWSCALKMFVDSHFLLLEHGKGDFLPHDEEASIRSEKDLVIILSRKGRRFFEKLIRITVKLTRRKVPLVL
jgi:hypothetical protein